MQLNNYKFEVRENEIGKVSILGRSFSTRVAQDESGGKMFCWHCGKCYIQVFMEVEGVEVYGPMKTIFSVRGTSFRSKCSGICIIISNLYYHHLFLKTAPITVNTLPKIEGWSQNYVKLVFLTMQKLESQGLIRVIW